MIAIVEVTQDKKADNLKEESKDKPKGLKKSRQSLYDEKHYRHYKRDYTSTCSSTPSYSSSCGGSGPTYRSC